MSHATLTRTTTWNSVMTETDHVNCESDIREKHNEDMLLFDFRTIVCMCNLVAVLFGCKQGFVKARYLSSAHAIFTSC